MTLPIRLNSIVITSWCVTKPIRYICRMIFMNRSRLNREPQKFWSLLPNRATACVFNCYGTCQHISRIVLWAHPPPFFRIWISLYLCYADPNKGSKLMWILLFLSSHYLWIPYVIKLIKIPISFLQYSHPQPAWHDGCTKLNPRNTHLPRGCCLILCYNGEWFKGSW